MNDEIIKLSQEKIAQGATQDEIIVFLHTKELGLDEAIRVFRNFFGGSFGQAKSLFWKHTVWQNEIESIEELTMEFIDCFSEDETINK